MQDRELVIVWGDKVRILHSCCCSYFLKKSAFCTELWCLAICGSSFVSFSRSAFSGYLCIPPVFPNAHSSFDCARVVFVSCFTQMQDGRTRNLLNQNSGGVEF